MEPQEISQIKRRPSNAFPSLEYICRVYESLCNRFQLAEGDGQGVSVYLDEPTFLRDWHLDKGRLRTSLEILSLSGYIKFEPYPNTQPYLRYDAPRWTLNDFLHSDTPASRVAEELLRLYAGLFSDGCFVQVDLLAKRTGIPPELVTKLLSYLRNVGFCYVPARKEPRITFLQVRTPISRLRITPSAYDIRLAAFRSRIEQVVAYLETTECRQAFISHYFGMPSSPCHCCDNCLKERKG